MTVCSNLCTAALALTTLVLIWAFPVPAAGAAEDGYGYPYSDPYVATVIGTPKELRAVVPDRIPVSEREVTVYEDRPLPAILWYGKKLRYSIARQDSVAPLIFLLPGMGAGHNAGNSDFLRKVFFQAGFHVVSLPSPTHPDFIPAASKNGIPGNPVQDALDLYRIMELIVNDLDDKENISGFHLAGYSLGAVNAAFLANLDARYDLFRFGKVILINPPVSLYESMGILDGLIRKIPGGEENFQQFFDEAFKVFSARYQLNEPVDFTGDFLYRGRTPNDKNLEALIGLSFRLAMASLVFTSDVYTNAGYIKPKNTRLSTTDSLTRYFIVSDLVSFEDYFRDLLLPYYLEQSPDMSEQKLIDQLSLKSIEPFLRNSGSVYLFHNADDILLVPGEIDYLKDLFGSRARIYPYGSHCGNLMYRTNVSDMLAVLQEKAALQPPGENPEPAPVLSMEFSPVPADSGVSAPPAFTAPRPASPSIGAISKEIDRRSSPGSAVDTGKAVEIIAARRSFDKEINPGLSYVIDVYDPLEPLNRALYRFNAVFDEYLFLPVTRAYEFVTPYFIQDRISGIFSNISEIKTLANSLIQLKPVKTGTTLARFLINSIAGLGGMWDPAASLGIRKNTEDFGQTLGRYGAGPGPYFVLPVFGPSSLRDVTGLAADATAQYFYLYMPTDMDENRAWGGAYTTTNAVDTRHKIPFRYYQTGSPFEYDLLRLLYKKKRELDIEQ